MNTASAILLCACAAVAVVATSTDNLPLDMRAAVTGQQYSIFEQYGFSLVPMDSATAIVFNGTSAIVDLPWAFTFDSTAYTTATVYKKGIISFGTNQVLAAYALVDATAVSTKSFTCAAPFPAGECFAVQWTQGLLTTQAVLTQGGDAYFIYLGEVPNPATGVYITTSATYTTYPTSLWYDWKWAFPSNSTTVALRATPRGATGLLSLPIADDFEGALSPSRWSHVIGGEISSICGSASGNKALTFINPTMGRTRLVLMYPIDVSSCANVSISFVIGPSAASGNCTPVKGEAWIAAYSDTLKYDWMYGGRHTEFRAVSQGATQMNLLFTLEGSDGMWFVDDLNVTCFAPKAAASSSAAQSSAAHHSSAAHSSATHHSSAAQSSATHHSSAAHQSSQKSASTKSSHKHESSSKNGSAALGTWVWTDPSSATVALRVTPRSTAGLIALPWAETFEGPLSSALWYQIMCCEVSSACGLAPGQRALTFAGPKCKAPSAMTWGIDVSACANVSVSFTVGPLQPKAAR
eukprot:m51a1_g950 hypothetical protein (522) ;mRNA; f:287298-289552